MWKLQPADSNSAAVSLIAGKVYIVGRKNCDILLTNDQSISREHAHLTVTEQTVTLKDASKYGTSINDKRIDSGSTQTLCVGDRLKFGVFQSIFKLELGSIVVCSSCVDNDGKAALSQAVQAVGGRLVNTWSQECTHLVMPSVKVTIKTICALLCCRPLVTPEYFTELSRAVQKRKALPKAESFRPKIDEPSLSDDKIDLSPRPERKNLFNRKLFVFLNLKQIKRLSQAISYGGGTSQLLEEGALPVSLLESADTCVIDAITGSSQPLILPVAKTWADSVGRILHRKGLRFITESEVGLAAIYASNQTYCNPCSSSNFATSEVQPRIPDGTLSQNAAVEETFLAPASLNITAYVVNTESSQDTCRLNVSRVAAIAETPEKHLAKPKQSGKTSAVMEPQITTFEKSPEHGQPCKEQGVRLTKEDRECADSFDSLNSSKTSPKKQSSLMNYFQPVNKKRPRGDSASSELSEPKHFRKDAEDQGSRENKNCSLSTLPINQQNLHEVPRSGFSSSLKLVSGSNVGLHSGSGENMVNKKRKEPETSSRASELDVSLEELESIMSEDMDEDLQPTAGKKPCLDPDETSKNNKGEVARDSEASSRSYTLVDKQLDRLSSANQESESKPSRSSQDVDEELSNIKDEEISIVVETRGFAEQSKMREVKQDPQGSDPENDPQLPRRVLQVQFKSLTVSAPCTTRPAPLQSRDSNGKNFKCFRKVPFPGLHVLPRIIGGSDLVPHNRGKNSEVFEWMREEEEMQKAQAQEDSQGNELFRYNPKSTGRR